jgi:hypothetical protein
LLIKIQLINEYTFLLIKVNWHYFLLAYQLYILRQWYGLARKCYCQEIAFKSDRKVACSFFVTLCCNLIAMPFVIQIVQNRLKIIISITFPLLRCSFHVPVFPCNKQQLLLFTSVSFYQYYHRIQHMKYSALTTDRFLMTIH